MTRDELIMYHNDWLRTYRDMQRYTDNFTAPLSGQTNGWFLDGPLVSSTWSNNAAWARSFIPKKHHAVLLPGVVYITEFARLQNQALQSVKVELDFCWKLAAVLKNELEKIEQ